MYEASVLRRSLRKQHKSGNYAIKTRRREEFEEDFQDETQGFSNFISFLLIFTGNPRKKLISHEKTSNNSEKDEKKPINPLLGIITATICFKTWVKFQALTKERLKETSFSLTEEEESEDSKENRSSSEEI